MVGATSPKSLNNSSVEFSPQGLGTSADLQFPRQVMIVENLAVDCNCYLPTGEICHIKFKKNEIGSYSSFEVFSFVGL